MKVENLLQYDEMALETLVVCFSSAVRFCTRAMARTSANMAAGECSWTGE